MQPKIYSVFLIFPFGKKDKRHSFIADSSCTVESSAVQIPGTMTIDGMFDEDLNDPMSSRYREIERETCQEV